MSKWILCDERLPKEGQMVLTTIRGHDVIIVQDEETFEEAIERVWNDVCYVSVGFIGSDGWYGADGYPQVVHPIAWMPLPKPYRAEQTEPSDDWICGTCKYHTIERAVQCKMCGDGGQYEPKTEPNSSEKPNNCEKCKWWNESYGCHWKEGVCHYVPKAIIPKRCVSCDSASRIIEAYSQGFKDGADAVKAMPQTFTADGIVFAKIDEPHPTCKKCKHYKYRTNCGWECEYDTFEECNYEPKDEPQTGTPCDGCEYSKPYIEYKCVRYPCKYEDEPQDCLTCKHSHDKWYHPYCDSCSKAHSNYEPQTERSSE